MGGGEARQFANVCEKCLIYLLNFHKYAGGVVFVVMLHRHLVEGLDVNQLIKYPGPDSSSRAQIILLKIYLRAGVS